ncbi:Cytochrome P450, E-class, group I [Trema orientale]|uniref:Cytochrome P450, E-class, group I n=1 Tax=Trema orientale TaxID=63057 RepID=A0A2P5ESZ1_TREOI|nr:Cytochrome P450, E-class, group I [Trema orientale]
MEYSHLLSLVNPTTVSGILAVLFLFYVLRKPRDCRRSPPEAGRAWPIIGHLPFLGDTKPISVILSHMADKYGPIFTIRTGVRKTIIVSSWEIAKECFTTNDIVFANRSKCMAAELMGYNYAMFGWSSYGPYWRHLRKIVTLELLSNHRLKVLSHLRESEVESAIKGIHELWVKNNKSELKVEMKKWFGDITLKTTLRMVVGKRLVEGERSKESSGDHDEGNDDRCRKVIKEFFDVIGAFPVSDAVPWLRWCDFGGYERAMKKKAKELDQLVEEWLEEHKRKIDDERDLMRVMLSLFDDDDGTKEFSSYDADTIIKATCVVSRMLAPYFYL